MIGKPIMIKSPQKDKLTTNLKAIGNYEQSKKHVNTLGKEVVYEPALYSWLERLREKKIYEYER